MTIEKLPLESELLVQPALMNFSIRNTSLAGRRRFANPLTSKRNGPQGEDGVKMQEVSTNTPVGAAEAENSSPESGIARRPRLSPTRDLPSPTEYVKALDGECAEYAFNEERAVELKGQWRTKVFKVDELHALDLEIGTGNGFHFAHLAKANPSRSILGIELKYKPLIQSIRRARLGAKNCAIARYDASLLQDLFTTNELNDVYIHFPDPWSKKRQWKHRLIQSEFLELLHGLMRPGSVVEFKTDNLDYFEWATERFHQSAFKVSRETRDLHASEWAKENFVTHFEGIFLSQGMKINYVRLEKI
jgi:tRNA (guanine-N7-)-methyltransferase